MPCHERQSRSVMSHVFLVLVDSHSTWLETLQPQSPRRRSEASFPHMPDCQILSWLTMGQLSQGFQRVREERRHPSRRCCTPPTLPQRAEQNVLLKPWKTVCERCRDSHLKLGLPASCSNIWTLSWIVSGRDINGGEGSNPIYVLVIRTWEEKSPPHKMSKKSETGPACLRESFQVCVCMCVSETLPVVHPVCLVSFGVDPEHVRAGDDGLHVQTEGTVYTN